MDTLMLVVGLTGGIGSGKSTVAQLFAEHQVPILDADLIARELSLPSKPAFEAIVQHFGAVILKADGGLNREKLREHIFSHPEEKTWLEKLLHPLITQEIQTRLQSLDAPYCIVVIPLLIETGPYPFIDRILLVHASPEKRLERLQKRDQTSPEILKRMMHSQAKLEESLAQAQDVIENHQNLEELRQQVKSLHQQYSSHQH